ncbi:MAG: flavodoxin-dependent (E)-4-hydroxy-3-methylbut-2-enyl-diphosphate synthase [Elusimicrobiota bacterium]
METREIKIGDLELGGDNPVRIQGMLKSGLENKDTLYREGKKLVEFGAELIRCAIPGEKYAEPVYKIINKLGVPVIADCHFQKKIVIKAIQTGFDKVRVNPGNMSKQAIFEVMNTAEEKDTAVRIGFNTGSWKCDSGADLASDALQWDKWLLKRGFRNYIFSLKSSSVKETVDANRMFSMHSDTPLHIGITATGPIYEGRIKSCAGLGCLLLDGIGDTIRVSLTGSSAEEVRVAKCLRNISSEKPTDLEIISCPTCSRSRIEVENLVTKFCKSLSKKDYSKPYKVAIMGCEVNGPGEASACDIGVCGTKKGALLIRKGKVISNIDEDDLVQVLRKELKKL